MEPTEKYAMLTRSTLSTGLGAVLLVLNTPVWSQSDETSPVTVVDTQEKVAGKLTPGQRRTHAKGLCAEGTFIASPDAHQFSRSPLFAGSSIPVTARFSLGGGKLDMPETTKNVRGMALRYTLPDGSHHMMAMLHTPVLGVSNPAAFLENIEALVPNPTTGKPDSAKLKAFADKHPESKTQTDFLITHNPPVSYATTPYYSLHAFRFINKDNQAHYVRWRFEPQDGTHFISDKDLADTPSTFLEKRLKERLLEGPVRWKMIVTLAEPGDTLTNPTIAWPKERKEIEMGTLTITKAGDQVSESCLPINFDPMIMSDGVEPSDDPILRFRSAAYAVSFGRRLTEQSTGSTLK